MHGTIPKYLFEADGSTPYEPSTYCGTSMPQDETLRKRRSLRGFVDAVAEDLGDDARRAYRAFMARSVGGQKGARAGCTYYDGDELRPRSRPRRRLVPDRLRDPRRGEEVAPVAASPPPRPAADRTQRSTIG